LNIFAWALIFAIQIMKAFLIILVLFSCFKTNGQEKKFISDSTNYIIAGKVYDSTLKQYLSSVSILCRNKYGTTSGYDGSFRLKLPEKYSKKNFSIQVFSLGYESSKIKIKNKRSPLSKDLLVYLKQRFNDMNEVFITQ